MSGNATLRKEYERVLNWDGVGANGRGEYEDQLPITYRTYSQQSMQLDEDA